jgi:hypothetical protein
MRALTILAVAGVTLSVHSFALGADVPLSVLNGGPSSNSIPATNQEPVAFIVSPREIVNPGVPTNLPIADLNGNSLLVQDASDPTGSGVRNRSRAVMALFDVNNANPPLLQVQASLGFDPTVRDSYFVFLNADNAAMLSTIGQLHQFIVANTAGTDYVQIFLDDAGFTTGSGPGGEFTDFDIADVNLNVGGLAFFANDFLNIDPGAPGASDGNVGSAVSFEVGILVLSDGGGPNPDVPTEYFCVRTSPSRVEPVDAAFLGTNDVIRVYASAPLVTDGDNAISSSDTNPAALSGDDFRVRVFGTGISRSLTDFLADLDTPRSVASVSVIGARSDVLEITIDGPVAQSDLGEVLDSTIGFASAGAGGDVYSFAGEVADPNLATYQSMTRRLCPIGANADTNFDLVIDFADLNAVLSSFGQVGPQPGDVNNDDVVDFADLNAVLSAFGLSCE